MYKINIVSNNIIKVKRIGGEFRKDIIDKEDENILKNATQIPVKIFSSNENELFSIESFGKLIIVNKMEATIFVGRSLDVYNYEKDTELKQDIKDLLYDYEDPIIIFKQDIQGKSYGYIIEADLYDKINKLTVYNDGKSYLNSDYQILKIKINKNYPKSIIEYKSINIYSEDFKDHIGILLDIDNDTAIIAINKLKDTKFKELHFYEIDDKRIGILK